jgi:gliding motility-associated lipoprotein GldH
MCCNVNGFHHNTASVIFVKSLKLKFNKRTSLYLVIACSFFMAVSSCTTSDAFEKTTFFPKHEWRSADKEPFTFSISDTASLYNIYIVLRHSDAYKYNNIWMNVTTQINNDSATTKQLELVLGDNSKGWLGAGMDDIYEHKILINRYPVKLKKGDYHFMLQHTMREDPLQYIFNAGIRVEKVQP